MPPLDTDRQQAADQVWRRLAVINELTAHQARLFVRSLQTSWRVPVINWTDRESSEQFSDAQRLVQAADIYTSLDGPAATRAIDCYRRAAEILEWLSRADDPLRTIAPIDLYAAGAFQLGDMPAMANALLGRPNLRHGREKLYVDFFRGDLDGVVATSSLFWREHREFLTRESSRRLLLGQDEDRLPWYLTIELVRSIGLIADTLRRGDTVRLDHARTKLRALQRYVLQTSGPDAWLLLRLLNATADRFAATSIYSHLDNLAADERLRNALRGFGREQFARGRGFLWTSQLRGIERLSADGSFALCTPTGSGKTLIATLALVKELSSTEVPLVQPLGLYLVPSRALAGEVEAKLTAELRHAGDFIVTGLYGGTDWGITDYWLTADRPTVLIATVEKADALIRNLGPLLLVRLKILIIDEAHQIVQDIGTNAIRDLIQHSGRAVRLESLVSRLLALQPALVRIALTAVAGGAAGPVARWVEGNEGAQPIGIDYRSTRQLVGVLQTAPDRAPVMLLEFMNGRSLFVRGRDEPVYLRLQVPVIPAMDAKTRNSLPHFNELSVLWTALHLRGGGRRILISVTQEIERTLKRFAEAVRWNTWQAVSAFDPPGDPDLRQRFDKAIAACADYCGEDSYEFILLGHGIATNHGQMPQRLRRLMVDLLDRRICAIAVATATLTEGVNLPFDMIFLTSLKRRSFDPANNGPTVTPMSVAEFQNLAGRAGRPGATEAMEGMTLIALPQRPSTTAAGKLTEQRRQIRDYEGDYELLRARLSAAQGGAIAVASPIATLLTQIRRLAIDGLGIRDDQAFLAWLERTAPQEISAHAGTGQPDTRSRLADAVDELDAFALAAIEEFERPGGAPGGLEAFLVDLWRSTFSRMAAIQEAWLSQAFVRRGLAIPQRLYPDQAQRRRLYKYGFSPQIGVRFEATAIRIRNEIVAAADYGTADPVTRFGTLERIGALIGPDPGFGFRIRHTATDLELRERWSDVLRWWVQAPDAPQPAAPDLRDWQRFVVDNLEYRVGMAIGAVVAQAWSEGTIDEFAVPSLGNWRGTTGLPWFGFWARELLRWGTLDPFVAFALSQGLTDTREQAGVLRAVYENWLRANRPDAGAEDHIDPQLFGEWQRTLRVEGAVAPPRTMRAELMGGIQQHPYAAIPLRMENEVLWIDPAGYSLARTQLNPQFLTAGPYHCDFTLFPGGEARVDRTFTRR